MATLRAPQQDIRRQGYLIKSPDLDKHKGIKGSFKGWKKRWFVFRDSGHNPVLSYYESEKTFNKEKKRPNGIIELLNCDTIERKPEIELSKHRYENVLCITCSHSIKKPHDRRVYYLKADSRAEMEDWYRVIQDVLVALGVMQPVEGDGLVRCNTSPAGITRPLMTSIIKKRETCNSAPTGNLIDQFKRRSGTSTSSSESEMSDGFSVSNTSMTMTTQKTIISEEDDDRVKCCQCRHVIDFNTEGENMADQEVVYVNVHFIRDQAQWENEVQQRKHGMAKHEQDYQNFSAIIALQDENVIQSETKPAPKVPPKPPARNQSLPRAASLTSMPSQPEPMAEPTPEQKAGRVRKLSQQLDIPMLLPGASQTERKPESPPSSPQMERHRKRGVPSLQPPDLNTLQYQQVPEASVNTYQFPETDYPPPDYDIPPVPVQDLVNRPLPVPGESINVNTAYGSQSQRYSAQSNPENCSRKMSHGELVNRPLPVPGQQSDNNTSPYSTESNLTSQNGNPPRRRKLSLQEVQARPLPIPEDTVRYSPEPEAVPPNRPRERKMSRQELLARPLPTPPGSDAQSHTEQDYTPYQPMQRATPQELDLGLPSRPLPPVPSRSYGPKHTSDYMSSASQTNHAAILLSPTSFSVSPRVKRRSRSGSLPNLLDDDDFQTFAALHPEVQARIPDCQSHPTPPPLSTLPRQTASLYSFTEPSKPKIPESRRTIKKRRKQLYDKLQEEINQKDGLTKRLPKEHLVNRSVALVEIVNKVWVAGWKSSIPTLPELFHLGDQILAINGQTVTSVMDTYTKIEQARTAVIEVKFRRVPLGQLYFMDRRIPEESWGIVVKGISGGITVHSEIDQVLIGGLAFDCGLKPKVQSIFRRLSSWAITEINFTTVSLFAGANKVRKDLNTGELDIILLVQPCDFIKEVKRQLQETKNWIGEILQTSVVIDEDA
ncbi:uncharacterized protein LOC144446687 [Glandiceps talaboti]